jgi:hypothetical protein
MRGAELKKEMARLARKHRTRPIEREPIPLLAPTLTAQIVEGCACTPDIDSTRMSFQRGSLSWPSDLSKLPLLIGHDANRVAGKIIELRYDDDGQLHIKALAEDSDARRMGAFSIAATVIESEIRNEHSASGYHASIIKATIDEISITDRPSNQRTLIVERRDATFDGRRSSSSFDEIMAAVGRAQRMIEQAMQQTSPPPASRESPPLNAAPPKIYGKLPAAVLKARRTPFASLVASLPTGH